MICAQAYRVFCRHHPVFHLPRAPQISTPWTGVLSTVRGAINPVSFTTDRSGTLKWNTVNAKFHLIQIFGHFLPHSYHLMSKMHGEFKFHLFRRKTLPMNKFELTVPDQYVYAMVKLFPFPGRHECLFWYRAIIFS